MLIIHFFEDAEPTRAAQPGHNLTLCTVLSRKTTDSRSDKNDRIALSFRSKEHGLLPPYPLPRARPALFALGEFRLGFSIRSNVLARAVDRITFWIVIPKEIILDTLLARGEQRVLLLIQ